MRNPETGRSTAARHPTRRTQMKKSSLDFSEVGRCGAKTRSGNKWKWKQMSCSRDAKPQGPANPACGGRRVLAPVSLIFAKNLRHLERSKFQSFRYLPLPP